MFSLPYKVGAAVLVAALLFGSGYFKGRSDGKVEQLEDTVKAYQKREGIDNEVGKFGAYALCVELGGLHADCEQLRGVVGAAEGQ